MFHPSTAPPSLTNNLSSLKFMQKTCRISRGLMSAALRKTIIIQVECICHPLTNQKWVQTKPMRRSTPRSTFNRRWPKSIDIRITRFRSLLRSKASNISQTQSILIKTRTQECYQQKNLPETRSLRKTIIRLCHLQ